MADPVFFSDAAPLEGVRRTQDKYMVAMVRAGRTGIQRYAGAELGRPDLADVRLYRPEDEVFCKEAMQSAAHRPATIDHPTEFVTADTWRAVAVGMTGGDVMRDGGFLSVPLVLMDAEAIQAVEDGKRELSWGYGCDIDWTPGTAPDGQSYDAVQRNIRINHLAVVDRGRAGPECRIGDAARRAAADAAASTPPLHPLQGERPVAEDTNQRAVLIDGLTVRTNDAGAEAIARLDKLLNDAKGNVATLETRLRDAEQAHRVALDAANGQVAALRAEMTRSVEAKDGEIAGLRTAHTAALEAKDGEIAALRSATSAAALDARVAQRSALIARVRPVLGDAFNFEGQSDAAIRRAVVAKAMGDKLTDADAKGEAFYDAAFDAVMAMAPAQPARPDQLRSALANGAGTVAADAAQRGAVHPWQRNVEDLTSAWKGGDRKGNV